MTAVWLSTTTQFEEMAAPVAALSLQDIARDAAAGNVITEYMELRGIKTSATLALLSKDEHDLETTVIQPLLQGWKRPDGTTLTVPDSDKPIARAVLMHMWMMAQQNNWAVSHEAMRPLQTSTQATPAPSASAAPEDKVPKALAPGRWAKLIQEYQGQQIDNEDRIFPIQEVLGAESIIARVLHEHEVSKTYTPIQLGEIISIRTFQANGEPNPLAKKDRSVTKLTLTGEQLVATPEEPWQPRSVLAILDGLSSIKWCYILCRIGSEQAINTFFDWLVRLVRSRPNKTDQMAQFWMSTSWKLALDMRAGKTFVESTTTLMKDYDAFSECMSREPTQTLKRTPATAPTPKTEQQKGSGKGNTKSGKNARSNPYGRASKPWGGSSSDRSDRGNIQWQTSQKNDDKNWSKESWSSDWRQPQK